MVLEERTRSWRRELRGRAALEGGARLAGAFLSALAVLLWADRAWLLPQNARLLFWGLGLGAAAVSAYARLWRPWKAADERAALSEASRAHPALSPYLASAWELRAGTRGHTSASLAREHIAETERLVAGLPPGPLRRWAPTPGAKRGAGLALAASLLLPWAGAGPWLRVLAPWRDVPLERYVELKPGDAAVDWGRPTEIRARWLERPGLRETSALTLWVREQGAWRRAPWTTAADEGASFVTAPLSEPLEYRLSWRDLTGKAHRLTPRPAPQLDEPRVKLEGKAEEPLTGAEPVSARRGTLVTLRGRPNQRLARAEVRVSFLPGPVPMRERPDGSLEASFVASEDGGFQFELESADGRRDPEPVSYALSAKANERPEIELLSPAGVVQAAPEETLSVGYAARDDSGVSRVSLLARYGGREVELPVASFAPPSSEHAGDHAWDLSELPVGRVEFRLKAVDDDPRAPLSGLSAPAVLELVDAKATREQLDERWSKAREGARRLAEQEERAAAALKRGEAAPPEAADLARQWRELAKALSELSRLMDQDPYANPGVREETQALASEAARAERERLPAAQEAERSGDKPRAARGHQRLAEQARRTEKLLGEGRRLQDLQDFHRQAQRMADRGAALEEALEAMKGLGKGQKPSAEATAKLQSALGKLQKQMDDLRRAIEALPKAEPASQEQAQRQTYVMPLLKAQTTADALSAALKAGDYELAAKIAQELAQELSAIQQALTQAAAQMGSGEGSGRASPRQQKAEQLWNQVVEEQRKLLEGSRRLEDKRRGEVLARQKRLLEDLAAAQTAAVSSAAALGAPPDALASMRAALEELRRGQVMQTPNLLRSAAARLRASGPAFAGPAGLEEEILRRLQEAPSKAEPDPSDPELPGLRQRQGQVRGRTGELQRELEGLEEEAGALPSGAVDKVESAQSEQAAAEEALSRGDASEAGARQQKALKLLEDGGEEMSQGAQRQMSIQQGMSQPAPRPGGRSQPGGRTGATMQPVPLPGARDYTPPRELREELERSQRESRPESLEPVIKEYFRRIAE